MFIRLEYKGVRTDWYDEDECDEMIALRNELFTRTPFSCYESILKEFSIDVERNDMLGKFLGWLDDDTYDSICNMYFEDIILDALDTDGEFDGITIEKAEEDDITDELENEAVDRYERTYSEGPR